MSKDFLFYELGKLRAQLEKVYIKVRGTGDEVVTDEDIGALITNLDSIVLRAVTGEKK